MCTNLRENEQRAEREKQLTHEVELREHLNSEVSLWKELLRKQTLDHQRISADALSLWENRESAREHGGNDREQDGHGEKEQND